MNQSSEHFTIAAEYALGLLSPEHAKAFEARMKEDPMLQQEYVYWAEHFSSMSEQWQEHVPPAHVKQQLEQQLFSTKADNVTQLRAKSSRRSPIWAIAAAVILAIGIWTFVPPSFEATYQTHLVASESDVIIDVLVDADNKQLRIIPKQGKPAINGDYELWVAIGDGAPMSLGVLDLSEMREVSLDVPWLSGLTNAHMAISHEPKGGSPTGAPTGPVIAVADTVTL